MILLKHSDKCVNKFFLFKLVHEIIDQAVLSAGDIVKDIVHNLLFFVEDLQGFKQAVIDIFSVDCDMEK